MRGELHLGFRIKAFLEPQRWKVIEIGPGMPLAAALSCPCDLEPLRTLCTLTDHAGSRRMRVGYCPSCGHITYIDRPTKAWMDDYYLESWDADNLERKVHKRIRRLAEKPGPEKTVVTLAKRLEVDRRRPVCEIGCGWGESLQHLTCSGFSTTVGTEASVHRASTVGAGLAVSILTGAFESEATQRELAALAPFSIILFESCARAHVSARRGDRGGIMPPERGRSFHHRRAESGRRAADGCAPVPASSTFVYAQISGEARGTARIRSCRRPSRASALTGNAVSKVSIRAIGGAVCGWRVRAHGGHLNSRHLHLHRWHLGLRRLWWERRGGRIGQRWMLGRGSLEARSWQHAVRKRGYREPRSLAIWSLRRRFTRTTDSALEIQFSGPISLLSK